MKNLTKGLIVSLMVGATSITASAGFQNGIMKHFKNTDSNKDGIVSHEEMMASVHTRFGKLDKNKDGYLELQELPREMPLPEKMQQRMEKHLARMAKRHGELDEDMQTRLEQRAARKHTRLQFVARLDRDGDERVSVEEFASRKIRHFKKADMNGDGRVTEAEAKDAMLRMKHHHKKMRRHG